MKNQARTALPLTDAEHATLEFLAVAEYSATLGFWEGRKIYAAAEEKLRKYFSFDEIMQILTNQDEIQAKLQSRAVELNLV